MRVDQHDNPAAPDRDALVKAARRSAFSLIELMIAIVILGLGMVMVASMFPVALGRAKQMSEQTRKTAITAAASATMGMIATVDSVGADNAGFAGDLIYQAAMPQVAEHIGTYPDDRVHVLHMENLRVTPRGYVPIRGTPWNDPLAPWRLEWVPILQSIDTPPNIDMTNVCGNPGAGYCAGSFLSPRLSFEARFYPSIRLRDPETVTPEGLFDPGSDDAPWDELLASRRFAWAVFHRRLGPDLGDLTALTVDEARSAVGERREFMLYYVTLRRPGSTLRFARQDPSSAPNPHSLSTAPAAPAAAPPAEDVVLPEPWRVQIQIPAELGSTSLPQVTTTGVPTEVQVPPDNLGGDPLHSAMLAQMFQRGTRFIDEITGDVFRVVKRRENPAGDVAFLTLDREITVEDVDLPPGDLRCPNCRTVADQIFNSIIPPLPDPEERLRTVWVFPPPVQPERMGTAGNSPLPAFDGPQPVVGIDTRTETIVPRQ